MRLSHHMQWIKALYHVAIVSIAIVFESQRARAAPHLPLQPRRPTPCRIRADKMQLYTLACLIFGYYALVILLCPYKCVARVMTTAATGLTLALRLLRNPYLQQEIAISLILFTQVRRHNPRVG